MRAMLTNQLRTLRPSLLSQRVDGHHPARVDVESFIAHVYRERYGARLTSFLPHLLAFRNGGGELQAATGLRYASEGPLFVEQYLDRPAEEAISTRIGRGVQRHELVEVGNFASLSAGDARDIIVRMTELLHGEGVRWVLFVATRQLRNAFNKLHLGTQVLAAAEPERLRDRSDDWGRYYDSNPHVLWGDIAAGYAHLHPDAPVHEQRNSMGAKMCGCAS
ncbi:thermostable hemolysin [Lysobacter soli]|uniref:thermostable hemolysin n=1 Tax=Lysobacter soli TaxID=453783 RepID=UPI00240F0835|nr:thermostable hemolysin [Lysobacter soli]MDG2518394.1 thermostable hemolysin [Lysobacter soli]